MTVTNSGSAALAIRSIRMGGATRVISVRRIIAAGAWRRGRLRGDSDVHADGCGNRTATLTVTDNSGNVAGAVQTVGLSGTGLLVPEIQLPASLGITASTLGNGHGTVTAKNTGSGKLTITNAAIDSGGDYFSTGSNTCVGNLTPGATCSVGVGFSADSTGTYHGTMAFTENAGNVAGARQTVTLTATYMCPVGKCGE